MKGTNYFYDPNYESLIKNPKTCSKCNHVCFNHWNLKYHMLSYHSSVKERRKEKYYCGVCDSVFFCKYYIDLHMKSEKHKKNVI